MIPLEMATLERGLSTAGKALNDGVTALLRALQPRTLYWLIVVAILGAFAARQIGYPITVGDTDMWYHMADGRYIAQNAAIPDTFYYSFVDWPFEPGAHFWLFQLGVYLGYEHGGYALLHFIRVALSVLGIALLIQVAYLDKATTARWGRAEIVAVGLLALIVCLTILGRTLQLRPQLFSIVFTGLTLLIFERQRGLWALPLIAVAWANLHGIEWIVAAAIAGAYCAEGIVSWLRGKTRFPYRLIAWSMAACLALLANPRGIQLFLQPFDLSPDYGKFVSEMIPLPLSTLISPSLPRLSLAPGAAVPIAAVASAAAWIFLLSVGRLRLSHALLALGGVVLLTQGNRFVAEWALLSLPMLRAFVLETIPRLRKCTSDNAALQLGFVAWVLITPFVAMPVTALKNGVVSFNPSGLPVGTAAFLRESGGTGKLFMPPSYAGFIAWESFPAVKIFSDMKHPDMPTFYNVNSFRDAATLRRVIDTHKPDFFAIDVGSPAHSKLLAAHKQYRPVFFDDLFVLYADVESQPAMSRWELSAIDPHSAGFAEEKRADAIAELRRIARTDPAGQRVRHHLWRLAFDAKDYGEAEAMATELLAAHVNDPLGKFMRASVLENTDRCPEALALFESIHDELTVESQRTVRRHEGACHYLTRDFASAYKAFREGMNPYRDAIPLENFYQFAFVAAIEGSTAEVNRTLDMLDFLSRPEDAELVRKAADLRRTVNSPD